MQRAVDDVDGHNSLPEPAVLRNNVDKGDRL